MVNTQIFNNLESEIIFGIKPINVHICPWQPLQHTT